MNLRLHVVIEEIISFAFFGDVRLGGITEEDAFVLERLEILYW